MEGKTFDGERESENVGNVRERQNGRGGGVRGRDRVREIKKGESGGLPSPVLSKPSMISLHSLSLSHLASYYLHRCLSRENMRERVRVEREREVGASKSRRSENGERGTNQVFEYDDTPITFSFVTQASRTYSGRGFTAVVTAFTEKSGANCSGTDFLCDNNRCISTSLECDGEQNCVDNTDEASCSSTTGAATTTTPSASTSAGATTSSAANVTSSNQSTTQSPLSSSPSATTQLLLTTTTQTSEEKSTFPGLGEKAVLVIIILSSAVIVTIIITAIVYKVWCTQNVVHPVLEIEEAPTTSFQPAAKPGPKPPPKSAPKPAPEPAPKTAPEPGPKSVPRGKAPTSEQPKAKTNPSKKTPPKRSLKKDAW
ncbi:mucin-5AC-like [Saccostrea cucullata]|uniref:mucin-5AC-like n=1 Tax=Saccostrea cuccullata TaxID=36930 RepID=UPI002ED2733E